MHILDQKCLGDILVKAHSNQFLNVFFLVIIDEQSEYESNFL